MGGGSEEKEVRVGRKGMEEGVASARPSFLWRARSSGEKTGDERGNGDLRRIGDRARIDSSGSLLEK